MSAARLCLLLALAAVLVFGEPRPASAQLSGSHAVGDMGLKSGSQAPPGVYLLYFLYDYGASEIVGRDGQKLEFPGGLGLTAHIPSFMFVSSAKVFGAHYGAAVFMPIQNIAIEAPRLGLERDSTYGAGDIYVQPINLGWQTPQADFTTWYAFYAPTGRFEAGANDNRGLGMWSHEAALGTTVYFDQAKSFHASALGAFEFHSKKKDLDAKVGTLLTIEGGVGATALMGGLNAGLAYYLQWKLTDDSGLNVPSLVEARLGKNRNAAFGPHVSLVLPLSKDLSKLAVFDFKYLFETGARLDTQGDVLAFLVTFKVK